MTHYEKLALGWLLLSWLILGIAGVLGWMSWPLATLTLVGSGGAMIGGVVIGVTARRFLTGPSPRPVYGVGTATAIGVVTIGFLYVFLMRYRMASISTFARTLSQSLIFVDFLVAQYIGVATVYPWLATWRTWHHA